MRKPPYDGDSPLAWQNYVVAQVAQAMLGGIGRGITAVSCRFGEEGVELHFAVPEPTESEREDIDDIAFELCALLGIETPIETVIHAGVDRVDASDPSLRGVYAARIEPA